VSAFDCRLRREHLLEHTIPALHHALRLTRAVVKEEPVVIVLDRLQLFYDRRRERAVHGHAGLLLVEEQFVVDETRPFETGGILYPQSEIAEQEDHWLNLRTVVAEAGNRPSSNQNTLDFFVAEWKRRILFRFRARDGHRRISIDSAAVVTESEEAAKVLESLPRGQRGVRPRGAEGAEYVDITMRRHRVALRLAEWKQLALEEFAPLSNGLRREVSRFGISQILLDRLLDRRNVGWVLAAVAADASNAVAPCPPLPAPLSQNFR
jgi:hypothetical protein